MDTAFTVHRPGLLATGEESPLSRTGGPRCPPRGAKPAPIRTAHRTEPPTGTLHAIGARTPRDTRGNR